MSFRPLVLTGTCIGAVTAGLLTVTVLTEPGPAGPAGPPGPARSTESGKSQGGGSGSAFGKNPAQVRPAPGPGAHGRDIPFGAFLGSGPEGVGRMAGLEKWLDGREPRVGHTYLPGDMWSNIEGRPQFLFPWAKWREAGRNRMFVLNVPMLERNEADVPDAEVARLLAAGARGQFDRHFRTLARRLVGLGLRDTVVVLGWEMNGTTYTHRCAPDPAAWKAYWRRIVTVMKATPGQKFRFDFAPARGQDAIGWTKCYPGDRFVDIIGMDSYDQPPGKGFAEHVRQPYGLQHQVDFAASHGKPVSYPEWGLFRDGDNPAYVRGMLKWIRRHRPVYHTITDYCPHGVWRCGRNPDSAGVFRSLMSVPEAGPRPTRGTEPNTRPTPARSPAPSGEPVWPPAWKPTPPALDASCVNLGEWLHKLLGRGEYCFRRGQSVPRGDG